MADQTLGTAKIVVEVDTTQVEAGTNRAKAGIKSLGSETAAAAEVATAAYNRQEKALLRQIQTLGLDQEGKLRYNIATRATAGNVDLLTKALDNHIAAQRDSAEAAARAAQAEEQAARPKLNIVRHNTQLEESERSLNERRLLGNKVLNDSSAATVNWAKEQQLANQRVADMAASEQRRAAPIRDTARATEEQRAALQKLVGTIDPTVAALARLDEQEKQLAEHRRSGTIGQADYDTYNAKLREQRALIGGVSDAMNRGGMSARQYSAAVRGLPAQFTDIAVSLQAGQAPLTVLLQQGGQLKDMFGGIGPAAQAMGGYIVGLVNPLTITAAALGAMTIGAYQGSLELGKLERSLISSGNAAGISASGMAEMAAQLDDISGVTRGKAVDAMAAVAATGAFTGEQMQLAAQAAVEWNVATGTAVDDTVKQFVRLSEDPVQAILELNKTMGFLTEAQLKVIQDLVEQGRQTDAATEAIRLMADTLHTRSGQMVENTGSLERAWKAVGNAVGYVWDQIKAIGRDPTLNDRINQMKDNLRNLENQTSMYAGLSEAKRKQLAGEWRAEIAELEKAQRGATATNVENTQSPEQRRALAERVAWEKETTREKQAQLTLEQKIAAMKADAAKRGITDEKLIADREKAMRDQEARRQSRRTASQTGDGGLGASQLAAIKAQGQAEVAEYATQTKELQAQYAAREVSAKDYYARMRALAEQQTASEVATLEKQQEALRQQTGRRQQSGAVGQQIAAIEAQIAKARTEGASRVRVLTTEEETAAKKREEGLRTYREAMAAQTGVLQAQMDSMVARERLGEREYEIQSKVNEVLAEQAKRIRDIEEAQRSGSLTAEEALQRQDILREEVKARVQVIRDGYAEADAARLDFSNGIEQGFAQFAAESMNVAGQVASALQSAFNGAADALVQFTQTGKLNFSELARSIMADLTRIALKIAMTKALESMFGGGGYGGAANASLSAAGSNRKGYSSGGYTGPGGKYEYAGDVHKGEVVFSQEDVARNGGVAAVERMRMGGNSRITDGGMGGATGSAGGGVVINLVGLDKAPKETRQSQMDGQLQIDMIFEQIDARAAEGVSNGTSRLAMALGRN